MYRKLLSGVKSAINLGQSPSSLSSSSSSSSLSLSSSPSPPFYGTKADYHHHQKPGTSTQAKLKSHGSHRKKKSAKKHRKCGYDCEKGLGFNRQEHENQQQIQLRECRSLPPTFSPPTFSSSRTPPLVTISAPSRDQNETISREKSVTPSSPLSPPIITETMAFDPPISPNPSTSSWQMNMISSDPLPNSSQASGFSNFYAPQNQQNLPHQYHSYSLLQPGGGKSPQQSPRHRRSKSHSSAPTVVTFANQSRQQQQQKCKHSSSSRHRHASMDFSFCQRRRSGILKPYDLEGRAPAPPNTPALDVSFAATAAMAPWRHVASGAISEQHLSGNSRPPMLSESEMTRSANVSIDAVLSAPSLGGQRRGSSGKSSKNSRRQKQPSSSPKTPPINSKVAVTSQCNSPIALPPTKFALTSTTPLSPLSLPPPLPKTAPASSSSKGPSGLLTFAPQLATSNTSTSETLFTVHNRFQDLQQPQSSSSTTEIYHISGQPLTSDPGQDPSSPLSVTTNYEDSSEEECLLNAERLASSIKPEFFGVYRHLTHEELTQFGCPESCGKPPQQEEKVEIHREPGEQIEHVLAGPSGLQKHFQSSKFPNNNVTSFGNKTRKTSTFLPPIPPPTLLGQSSVLRNCTFTSTNPLTTTSTVTPTNHTFPTKEGAGKEDDLQTFSEQSLKSSTSFFSSDNQCFDSENFSKGRKLKSPLVESPEKASHSMTVRSCTRNGVKVAAIGGENGHRNSTRTLTSSTTNSSCQSSGSVRVPLSPNSIAAQHRWKGIAKIARTFSVSFFYIYLKKIKFKIKIFFRFSKNGQKTEGLIIDVEQVQLLVETLF